MAQKSLWEWIRGADPKAAPTPAQATGAGVTPHARGLLLLSHLPSHLSLSLAKAQHLHTQIESHLGPVDLVLTDNRRRMVSTQRRRPRLEIRLHHMFVGCEAPVAEAIAGLVRGEPGARECIQEFIARNRDAIRFDVREVEIQPLGAHHDLNSLLDQMHAWLLAEGHAQPGQLDDIAITWGRLGRGERTIRLGSFDFDQRLVRIHPLLDQDWVPEFFVEFIVYHELLHAIYPPVTTPSRRVVHTPIFRQMERLHPRYDEAMRWEAENIRKLLGKPARRRVRSPQA